jgi:hypothetical protein
MADLTNRLAVAEEKVTALKGERSRLYQQLAESSSASRTQASAGSGLYMCTAWVRAVGTSTAGTELLCLSDATGCCAAARGVTVWVWAWVGVKTGMLV